MSKCNLTLDNGGIAVSTPYDDDFLYELKRYIPSGERRWDKPSRRWVVALQHGKTIQDICQRVFGELPLLPQIANVKPTITQKILDVRYIGATKDRGGDERSAYGWYADGWNVIFLESVLRGWFEGTSTMPDQAPTLYSVLGIKRDATADEIKKGFWRMAKQWHPDVSKEPNTEEQFKAINHAYEVLKDSMKRERYDAGLALEASLKNTPKKSDYSVFVNGYRSPLRCGMILCEGTESMGLFQVSKIFAWQDITDAHGRVLVVSWKAGDDHFTEVWA